MLDEQVPRTRHAALLLWVLCGAQFMLVLDTSVATVALPWIEDELGFTSPGALQLVISLYALTLGGSLIVAGRTADVWSAKRVFVTGLVVFTAASVACGLATVPGVLLVSRGVQGVGAALASAAGLAVLTRSFPVGRERNHALGVWGAVGGAAGAAGLVIGGLLTETVGWRTVFLVNLPIGGALVAGALGAIRLAAPARVADRRVSVTNAAVLLTAVGLLILGLGAIGDRSTTDRTVVVLLAGAIVSGGVFAILERRSAAPVVPVRIFTIPGTAPAYVMAFALNAVIGSSLFFTTLFMQRTLGAGPLATGLGFLPNSALVVVGAFLAGRFAARSGGWRILTLGGASLIAGMLVLATVRLVEGYGFPVLPGFALVGLGLGLAFTSFTIMATEHVPERDQGSASGLLNTAQQLGFAIGVATVVTIAQAAPDPVTGYGNGYLVNAGVIVVALVVAVIIARASDRTASWWRRGESNP